jgi:hypothetical protein
MNRREAPLLIRLQDCLNRMSGLYPSNPADLKAKLIAHDQLTRASGQLMLAVSCVGFRDYEDAAERLDRAERILGVAVIAGVARESRS